MLMISCAFSSPATAAIAVFGFLCDACSDSETFRSHDRTSSASSSISAWSPRGGSDPVAARFDLGAAFPGVRLAFRPDGDGFVGGNRRYSARFGREGGLTLTPSATLPRAGQTRARNLKKPTRAETFGAVAATFETVSVARDGATERLASGEPRTDAGGVLLIERGEAVERLQNLEDGVEQSWVFAQRPQGSGPLQIRVRVQGQRFVGESEKGFHFADSTAGSGFCYRKATWVDARGRRTAVQGRFQQGAVVLNVPQEVLDRSAYPAVLDPVISPEYGVDNPVPVAQITDETRPAVAADGTDYLVVWADDRNVAFGRLDTTRDIYGARLTQDGRVLDPAGFAIANAVGDQAAYSPPAVAFDGTNYLVVWEDQTVVDATVYGDIYGARVSQEGKVLTPRFPISSNSFVDKYAPQVAFDGVNFWVVWEEYAASNRDVYGARVDKSGVVLDQASVPISTSAGTQSSPAVSCAETTCLVVWYDSRRDPDYAEILATRVDRNGGVLGPEITVAAGAELFLSIPAVAFDGTNYLVIWRDDRGEDLDIYGARVTATGSVLDPNGFVISNGIDDQTTPDLAFDGADFLVVWDDFRSGEQHEAFSVRVSPGGAVVGISARLPISVAGYTMRIEPAVACGSKGCLVTGEDHRMENGDIYGIRLTQAGVVLDPGGLLISSIANAEREAIVAFDGKNFLLVWEDGRAAMVDIYGGMMDLAGVVIDPLGISISNGADDQLMPALACGGGDCLAVWADHRNANGDIYGARIGPAGAVLDPAGLGISTDESNGVEGSQFTPSVGFNGSNFLVVWEDDRIDFRGDIYGAVVTSDGLVLDPTGRSISADPESGQVMPAIGCAASTCWVIWEDRRNDPFSSDIYGVRIKPDGTRIDPADVPIAVADDDQDQPVIACDGTDCLAVWRDQREGPMDIYGALLRQDGTVEANRTIATAALGHSTTAPAVAHDGAIYLVVWEDMQANLGDIFAVRGSSDGSLLDSEPFAVSADWMHESRPAVASNGAGAFLVAYHKLDLEAPFDNDRVRARIVIATPDWVTCSVAAECQSGFCVDGVCCDQPCGGNDSSDCRACSFSGGARINGTCGAVVTRQTCRESTGPCDQEESCDGVGLDCPSDLKAPDGTTCPDGLCVSGACVSSSDGGDGDPVDGGEDGAGGDLHSVDGDGGLPEETPDANDGDSGPADQGADQAADQGADQDANGNPKPDSSCGCQSHSAPLVLLPALLLILGKMRRRPRM